MIVIVFMLVLACASTGFSSDGIIEIYSEPSGANVYIDGIYTGKTPYQNYEIAVGKHSVKVFYSDKYEPRFWDPIIDEITPQYLALQ